MSFVYVKPERVVLKGHPELTEAWLRDRIVEDPTILGLGELEVKDVERIQPGAGRLDLLLYDPDVGKRYEVELMLGAVDESHIIRCIEYWDIERKRYPQYDHAAVLIAEDITARFRNVIALFNAAIPMIAIQLNALSVDDKILLSFTTVLDEVVPGDEDEDNGGDVDRDYWEKRASKESLEIVDLCVGIIREVDPSLGPKYSKFYIGLADQVRARNAVVFRPKKKFIRVEARCSDRDTWRAKLEEAGVVTFVRKSARLHLRLTKQEAVQHTELLKELFHASCSEQDA